MLKHILVFFAAGVVDSIWALYIMACADKTPVKAALWGATVMAIGAFITITYVDDHSYLPTAIIGGTIGTYLTVRFKK